MKTHAAIRRIFYVTLIMTSFVEFSAASSHVILETGSVLWLAGDSTLHPFQSRTSQLKVSAELDPEQIKPASSESDITNAIFQHNALKQLQVTVPVQSLKSDESGLDKNMYKDLKAEENPDIVFHLSTYSVIPSTMSALASHITATGTLEIAGHEQPIQLEGEAASEPSVIHVLGQYTLLMSDYGVKPPTMMMGTIKVKDRVIVHFDFRLRMVPEEIK